MATSQHEGLLRTGLTLGGSSPLDASIAKDYVLNNLLHLADEYAQVRMALNVTGGGYLTPPTSGMEADTYYLVASSGPFPIPLRQNGAPYAVRIKIAGACSNAFSVNFRVVLSPPRLASMYANAPALVGYDWVWNATATGTSASWLSGTTSGLSASPTLLTVDAFTAAGWLTNTATLDDLGGNPATVAQCLVGVHVFASTADTSRHARLYAAYAAEYVGAT